MSNASRTLTTLKAIIVAQLMESDYKNHNLLAQLKQTVTTKSYYPAMKIKNSLSDNIFDSSDFGEDTDEQEFTSESTRTALMLVPKGQTIEQVQALLDKIVSTNPKSKIYRILSNHPILSAEHRSAIAAGLRTKDEIANKQVIRYGEGHANEGELILDPNGKVQYKYTAFTKSLEDVDNRTEDPNDMYLTEELQAELQLGTSVPAEIVEVHMQNA